MKIADTKLVGTYTGPRITPPTEGGGSVGGTDLPIVTNWTVVPLGGHKPIYIPREDISPLGPAAGWPQPDYLVSFYFNPVTPLSPHLADAEQWIPGGIVINLKDVVLVSSEGLSNEESANQVTFQTDYQSVVEVTY
jgi:hypothetical protein